jgi:hypothetical protein
MAWGKDQISPDQAPIEFGCRRDTRSTFDLKGVWQIVDKRVDRLIL